VTSWAERARAVLPGGASTGSKRPDALYGALADDPALPTHFVRSQGCRVWDTSGRDFIDCGMALGAVGLGYADAAVTEAVQAAVAAGNVSTLTHRLEVEVAERLVAVFPGAEQVRFLRTGAEAGAAAVRLARAITGREHVLACGYFGWLDWNSDAAGVPAAARELVTWLPFNDRTALTQAVDDAMAQGRAPAAIVIEPLVHDIASREWLQQARALATQHGALLIFDEVKTAFRVRRAGVQHLHGVTPDLTTLGKALANGFPLSAVLGPRDVMDAARRSWISSTAASETSGLAAAQAVLACHAAEDVCAGMAHAGRVMRDIVSAALQEGAARWHEERSLPQPAPVYSALGPDVMWRIESSEAEALDLVVAAAADCGVLLKRGAYQFGALAHSTDALTELAARLDAFPQHLLARAQAQACSHAHTRGPHPKP
jgi:glutamate-1-semialdehyde 2,1-aminomutase